MGDDQTTFEVQKRFVDYAAETPTRAPAGFPTDEPSAEAWIADTAHATFEALGARLELRRLATAAASSAN